MLRVDRIEAGDEERLEAVLRSMPGVFSVVVSSTERCAEVDFADDEVDLDRLIAALEEAGFRAQVSG